MSVRHWLGRARSEARGEVREKGRISGQASERGERGLGMRAYAPLGLVAAKRRVAVEEIVLVLKGEPEVPRELAQPRHLRVRAAAATKRPAVLCP